MDFSKFTQSRRYKRSSLFYELHFDFFLRDATNHNKKTFDGYKSLIQYLENHPGRKIFITLTQTDSSFEDKEGIVINLRAYQDFWRKIGQSGQDRAQAFLSKKVKHYSEDERKDVIAASTPEEIVNATGDFSEVEKGQLVSANATEKNILETIQGWSPDAQQNILKELRKTVEIHEDVAMVSRTDEQIIAELKGKNVSSAVKVIKELSAIPDVQFAKEDLNMILKRRERLIEFEKALTDHSNDEAWWQNFFENNKWIFGYGLNYRILKQEQSQPHYGGMHVDGQGGQRGDYLTSTEGDVNFTVLVEIKKPGSPLLRGTSEIRNGAWSLSQDLTDAISQIEANIQTWTIEGSRQDGNRDRFEGEKVFTVQPKGILVIGSLSEVASARDKRETFQRFRNSIQGVDILTFDELYKRAKFIVDSKE